MRGDELQDSLQREIEELTRLRQRLDKVLRVQAGDKWESMMAGQKATEAFLRDPDWNARSVAITLLAEYWKVPREYSHVFETIALNDPVADVRGVAVTCLGTLFKATKDRRVQSFLARVVSNNSEDCRIREAAYRELFRVEGTGLFDSPPLFGFNFTRDVKWGLVRRYLT